MDAAQGDQANELGRRIRSARGYAEKSQLQLGELIGVDGKTINRWERGHHKPDVGRLLAIIAVTGVRPDWFDLSLPLSAAQLAEQPAEQSHSPSTPSRAKELADQAVVAARQGQGASSRKRAGDGGRS